MIADCAIEPEVFANWQHFQNLYPDFGVSRGRLISKFPGKWVKRVAEHARTLVQEGINTEMQAAKIEERLRSDRFKLKLKSSGGRAYDPELSWPQNADDATPPFDLIVTDGALKSGNRVGVDMLLRDEAPFLWGNQKHVERSKEQLIEVAAVLLSACEEIVIVDPNFRADESRFLNSIKHLIDMFEAGGKAPKRFEIHTNRIRRPGESFVRGPHQSQWTRNLVPSLPAGWQLSVCYWDELPNGGKQHARFLLTDIGGLHYDHGIDEGDGQTLVTLLDEGVWSDLFKLFDVGSLPDGFDPEEHVLNFVG
jgi:hypothetical protein